MRLPPFERSVRGMQMVGVLLLGMIIGAIVYNSFYLAKTEALITLKSELEVQLEQSQQDIKRLNQFKNQHSVIKSVKPRIEAETSLRPDRPKLDQVTEAALIKRIKEDLNIFLGRSIYEIDSDASLARHLLDRKVYPDIYGKDYSIEIKTVLVADNELQVWVRAGHYTRPPT